MMNSRRVVVAMSGGVDSSMATYLLLEQGWEVIGVSMKLPDMGEISCCGVQGIEDARGVAQKLGIPFYALNYEDEFKEKVIDYFSREYLEGRTPNPCIICNEKIKFGSLLDKAKELGAEFIVTGHYARIEYHQEGKRWTLKKGSDLMKDQSYFLFSLSQEQLSCSIFPLGDFKKGRVRELAKEFGLKVHDKEESQEICFAGTNYRQFFGTQTKMKSGTIVNVRGEKLGEHHGIHLFTIGQRGGLGISAGYPLYVLAIDKERNRIVVGREEELYQKELEVSKANWISIDSLKEPMKCRAKIRYKHKDADCTISPSNDKVKVKFDEPQRAITPGQAAVFYHDDIVIGGGWIT